MTFPITLPMFMWTFSFLKLMANSTRVSQAVQLFISGLGLLEWLDSTLNAFPLPGLPPSCSRPSLSLSLLFRSGERSDLVLATAEVVPAELSSSAWLADMLRSPRNIRRTMERRYHAFGKARISVRRRMSYLNEAEPISVMAGIIGRKRCIDTNVMAKATYSKT